MGLTIKSEPNLLFLDSVRFDINLYFSDVKIKISFRCSLKIFHRLNADFQISSRMLVFLNY